jgi:hypothetical protein
VLSLGSAGSKWELERISDWNTSAEAIPGSLFTVAEGTAYALTVWSLTTVAPITLNTTVLNFEPAIRWESLHFGAKKNLVNYENAAGELVTDFGLVEALPGSPSKGDRCQYIADKTNGVIWHLIYDGEGTYPWKKIGGAPLFGEVETQQGTESTSYANLATTGPSITAPLRGDYDVEIGAYILAEAAALGAYRMSYAIGAAAASDNDAVVGIAQASQGHASVARAKRQTGLAASTALVAKYKASAGKAGFRGRWMRIDPVRVG